MRSCGRHDGPRTLADTRVCRANAALQPRPLFTTEYPANGSFFRPQNPSALAKASAVAVCKELSRVGSSDPVSVSSEFIMVKLLRAYGECLGARSR
jgi:hypothetical protein